MARARSRAAPPLGRGAQSMRQYWPRRLQLIIRGLKPGSFQIEKSILTAAGNRMRPIDQPYVYQLIDNAGCVQQNLLRMRQLIRAHIPASSILFATRTLASEY